MTDEIISSQAHDEDKCTELEFKALMGKQMDLIQRHLHYHQLFRGIEDKNIALKSFAGDFAWIMREMYCGNVCSKGKTCKAYTQYLDEHGWKYEDSSKVFERADLIPEIESKKIVMPCIHLADLLGRLGKITEVHINEHKWFRGIGSPEDAIGDFVDKFGWVARDMYCGGLCPDEKTCEMHRQYLKQFEGLGV